MNETQIMELALAYHQNRERGNGKIEVVPRVPVKTPEELALAYTPGVALPCLEIEKDIDRVYDYTAKGNTVFIVTDGSAVLGLGNIGSAASLPVMEGKALLFKIFGGIDAYPIALKTQDSAEIIETVKRISTGAGGINLEDISAPRCFEIEDTLSRELDIPVFHDDQHGTAVVTLAGLLNSLRVTGKKIEDVKIIVNGSGAAGIAVTRLLLTAGVKDIIMCDTQGAIFEGRGVNMNHIKEDIARVTNPGALSGSLARVIEGADIFIGVSAPGVLTPDMVRSMNKAPIIFAMANPVPEIFPDAALEAGALIVATGRSDFPNQVNNCVAFPGIFRGLLDVRASRVTEGMKLAAARAIADFANTEGLSEKKIIPSMYDLDVHAQVAEAVAQQAIAEGVAGISVPKDEEYERARKMLERNRERFF